MRATAERDGAGAVLAAFGPRLAVMKLEVPLLAASPSRRILERALSLVSLPDRASNSGRNVSRVASAGLALARSVGNRRLFRQSLMQKQFESTGDHDSGISIGKKILELLQMRVRLF